MQGCRQRLEVINANMKDEMKRFKAVARKVETAAKAIGVVIDLAGKVTKVV